MRLVVSGYDACGANVRVAMADNKKSSEMDDVLSSVRRLVTNKTGSGSDEQDLKVSEKLLLTPALRIESGPEHAYSPAEDAEIADAAPDTEPVPEALFVDAPEAPRAVAEVLQLGTKVGRAALEERIAELEAAVESRTGEWEPDGSEAVDTETPRRFVFTHTPRTSEDAVSGDAPTSADETSTPAATAEDTAPSGPPALGESAADAPEAAASFTVSQAVSRAVRDAVEKESRKAVAEMAADAAGIERQENAPQAGHSVPGAEPATPEPATAEPATAEPANGDKPTADTGSDPAMSNDLMSELAIDEGLLRDMVSEIVRQELQGALGERITRNVRKLVRREIHRAIMTRDFS